MHKNNNRYLQKKLCAWHIAKLLSHFLSFSSHKNLLRWYDRL